MLSAFTEEIDDVEAAVSEIFSQLDLGGLMKNSLGILHCYYEFIDSGLVKTLSEKLPFEIVGTTMPYVCLPGKKSLMGLILNVLTGDDVDFITGISEPVETIDTADNINTAAPAMAALHAMISGKLEKPGETKPAMLLTFMPFRFYISGDEFVGQLNKLFPDVPFFGALPMSDEPDFSKSYVLYNGEHYEKSAVAVALTGNVNPEFLAMAVPERTMLREKVTVTEAAGNTIRSVDGIIPEDYLISIGLVEKKGELGKLIATPMIVDLEDGSRRIVICLGGNERGGLILTGNIPAGSKIGFSVIESSDIVSTSGELTRKALEISDGRNMLIYSCVARFWFLGPTNSDLEIQEITGAVSDGAPFYAAYCGGEIFPQQLPGGRIANHFQNYSLIICIL